jgi:hypothetical protein
LLLLSVYFYFLLPFTFYYLHRNDPNDWECLQLFGDWYANQEEASTKPSLPTVHPIYNISFYSYYNLRSISVIHDDYPDCPRLQMFKATLQTQHQSLTAACSTIHQVIDDFMLKIFKQSDAENILNKRQLIAYFSSLPSSRSISLLLPLLKERGILSLFYYEYLPMMINNEMICFLIDYGLSSHNVKDVLSIFDEVKVISNGRRTADSAL